MGIFLYSHYGRPTVPVVTIYRNRVLDSVAGDFVRWPTDLPDPTGVEYPGPGVFGTNTTDYCIEAIIAPSLCTNRVFDTVANNLVWWVTTTPDTAGGSYPGPGIFGVETSGYCIQKPPSS